MDEILADLGITLIGTWPSALRANFDDALFNRIGVEKLKLWFKDLPVSFRFGGSEKLAVGSYYGLTSGSKITFFANQNTNPVINILHECGHVVDNLWDDFFTNNLKGVESAGRRRTLPDGMVSNILACEAISYAQKY